MAAVMSFISARSRAEIESGRVAAHQPVHGLQVLAAAELAAILAEQDDRVIRRLERAGLHPLGRSISPTTPMTGVG